MTRQTETAAGATGDLNVRRVTPGARSWLDRAIAAAVLVVLALPLALIAAAIKADSRGPVFFRQSRAGRHGHLFGMYKFRTMVDGAEHIGLGRNVAHDDDRITRVGRVLRTTSIDEWPQLINVALGQMTFIGPRPAPPEHLAHYTDRQRRRLEVPPGLTGWAQVNGRNALSWDDRIELDVWYVDHWSPALDVRILLRTPLVVLSRRGLYGPDGVTTDLEALRAADEARMAGTAAVDRGDVTRPPPAPPAEAVALAKATPATIEFRVVGPSDAPALAELFTDIDETFFRPHPFTAGEATRICEQTGRDIHAMLVVDGRPVAYGMLRGWDEGYDTPSLGIAVRNDAQGRGYGRLMMARLHGEARAHGADAVRLRVHPDNVRARRLYETLGYAYRGTDRGELVMVVDVSPGA